MQWKAVYHYFRINEMFIDKRQIYLDAIITVVDAKYVIQHLDEERPKDAINEAQRQIAFAGINAYGLI